MKEQRLTKQELLVLIGLVAFIVLTFLPWTHDIMLAEVSLLAWLLWSLMIIAAGTGIVLALREPRE